MGAQCCGERTRANAKSGITEEEIRSIKIGFQSFIRDNDEGSIHTVFAIFDHEN
jgi:hypothetical protein